MKSLDQSIYTKKYYLNSCSGFDEFLRFAGDDRNKRARYLEKLIKIEDGMKILDLGCGKGELAFYLAKKGAKVVGIDYSKSAIYLANKKLRLQNNQIRKNLSFTRSDAKKLNFRDDYFDLVVSIDVFEHLYKKELEVIMKNISRVLKKNGILFVHTEANKIYLDFTHKYYVYPISNLLIKINKLFTRKDYPGLSKDPRNKLHKIQHVNEPTYFYLKNLFKRYDFDGRIMPLISLLKPIKSWKDRFYNLLVLFYPICFFAPFHFFLAYDFLCIMKNNKD